MKVASTLVAFTLATTLASISSTAHALPIEVELGAQAGLGSNPSNANVNPLGFGIGARGGVSIIGIYGGLRAIYYLGGEEAGVKFHSLQYGIEGGFNIRLLDDLLTIRPQLGIGNYTLTASGSIVGVNVDTSDSKLYLEPGVVGYVSFGGLFVGADINLLAIPGVDEPGQRESKTWTAVTMHGQVGFKF